MDLHDVIALLRTRWPSILATALLGVGAGAALALTATPLYEAKTQVFVSVRNGVTAADLWQGSSFTQQQIASYTQTVTSPLVLQPVAERLDGTDATALAKQISASSPADTVLINIAVSDPDPERAAEIANLTAQSFATVVGELETPDGSATSPVRVSVVRPAAAPLSPASPSLRLNLVLGFALGTAGGLALAFLRHSLDTRVRDERDVATVTSASVLGVVADHPGLGQRSLTSRDADSAPAEAYRRLRTNLQFARSVAGARTLLVTSALEGEGKSTTAMNLALAIAEAGSRVVLVDADLRRPSIARALTLEGIAGLTTVLVGRARLEDVVQPWGTTLLDVLPSGERPPNPSEMLGSDAMRATLEQLALRYDVIVIDSSPLLPVTDAAVLSTLADGTVLVAGCDRVHRGQLRAAVSSLANVDSALLGIVLNRVARQDADPYGYGYGYVYGGTAEDSGLGRHRGSKGSRRGSRTPRGTRGGSAGSAGSAGSVAGTPAARTRAVGR